MPINVELLQRIQGQIRSDPASLYMAEYQCGTACCIAGWALQLSGEEVYGPAGLPGLRAADLLGLDPLQARNLFLVENWPVDLHNRYYAPHGGFVDTLRARAVIACELIDRVIASAAAPVVDGTTWKLIVKDAASDEVVREVELCL